MDHRVLSLTQIIESQDDDNSTDEIITSLIRDARLNKDNNNFFARAAGQKNFDIDAVFNIAYNWREITKTFLFSTIKGLGCLAEKLRQDADPNPQLLSVLQTSFSIISDDIGNTHPIFNAYAPSGPTGIHYKWWEETILNPLNHHTKIKTPSLSPGTIILIQKMEEMTNNYLGVAVQLRVVEVIALDICIAFLAIFSQVIHQGERVFNDKNDMRWITTHIQAESIHHERVCNKISGMTKIAITPTEQQIILKLIQEYANAWAIALTDFAKFLETP